ncbi:MAG: Mov34/MPN/PAD-1 family protein, partial [Anaerolineaceae bacterium]
SGLTVLAIFHSHPAGPDFPSETDLAEFTYLDTITLIFSKRTGAWQARGYQISGRSYQEITLVWE